MKRILSICVLVAGIGCMVCAAVLFWQSQSQEQVALQASQSVAEAFAQQVAAKQTQDEEIQDVLQNSVPTLEVEGERYMGLLSIPTLDLTLPIASPWSETKLSSTPCAYQGTIQEGNLIIAAHNFTAHFGTIHQLQVGDVATITDGSGQQYQYIVTAQETIDGNDLDGLYAGDWDLTLFTCLYGNNTQRVVVRLTQQGDIET